MAEDGGALGRAAPLVRSPAGQVPGVSPALPAGAARDRTVQRPRSPAAAGPARDGHPADRDQGHRAQPGGGPGRAAAGYRCAVTRPAAPEPATAREPPAALSPAALTRTGRATQPAGCGGYAQSAARSPTAIRR